MPAVDQVDRVVPVSRVRRLLKVWVRVRAAVGAEKLAGLV